MRGLRRLAGRRRRPIAAVLAGAAVACVLLAVRTPDGVEVLAAARDLPGGRLASSDVMVVRLPPDAVPAGAYAPGTPVTGRVVAGALRRGEPLTDARLLGPGLFRRVLAVGTAQGQEPGAQTSGGQVAEGAVGGAPDAEGKAAQVTEPEAAGPIESQPAGTQVTGAGLVATPIRIADPDAARLLFPGDVIDVLAAFEDGPFQARTVAQEVRVIARPPGRTDGGALLVLATTPGQAAQLAQAQAQGRLFVAIHPR
ncbi:SAF domain-containing protein [Microbispora sp. ZYX-F-249]|uniref:SAF domain-containing protein n=1 Tax=Microbispora maris TaxID=3144104 RepID=A0ABV0AYA6_9ACTN